MNARNVRTYKFALAVMLWLAATLHPLLVYSSNLSLPDGARYVFQKVGDDLGMATITPVGLFQDRQGFIWIASMSGLLRYDGFRVVRFGPEQDAPNAVIEHIDQDSDGRIWVVSRRGLAVFDGVRFNAIDLPVGVRSLALHQAFALRHNLIYLATDNGLWMLAAEDGSASSLTAKQQIFPGKEVELVYTGKDGRVWFSLRGRVGWLDDGIRPHFLQAQKGIPKEPMVALLQDGKRRLWLRTVRHLVRLDPGAEAFVPDAPDLPPANDVGSPSLDQRPPTDSHYYGSFLAARRPLGCCRQEARHIHQCGLLGHGRPGRNRLARSGWKWNSTMGRPGHLVRLDGRGRIARQRGMGGDAGRAATSLVGHE